MEAQPEGQICGGVQSDQVPSKLQDDAGDTHEGSMKCAQGCMGLIHRDFCTALSVDETAIHAA